MNNNAKALRMPAMAPQAQRHEKRQCVLSLLTFRIAKAMTKAGSIKSRESVTEESDDDQAQHQNAPIP